MFHPSSVHLSIYLSVRLSVFVRRLRGWGGWFFFDGGLLFHKINKWYLRSGVESITNGGGRKGNLGRSAQAGDGTEWLLTVKYNQCITKHITRGLLKNPSTPSLPPMKMADIIMADMVWHWKSLSESLGETFFIVVPHRNRRCDVSLQVNGWARGGYFSITYMQKVQIGFMTHAVGRAWSDTLSRCSRDGQKKIWFGMLIIVFPDSCGTMRKNLFPLVQCECGYPSSRWSHEPAAKNELLLPSRQPKAALIVCSFTLRRSRVRQLWTGQVGVDDGGGEQLPCHHRGKKKWWTHGGEDWWPSWLW